MNKSESISALVQAVLKVMAEVKGIDKSLTVGSGNSSYQGVADKDVKKIVGEAMERNGLTIFPIEINETSNLSEWDEMYNGQAKRKTSVFTKVTVSYLLAHNSGEFIEIKGYGHGVDSQDKSAGKATTYALKYTLLYTFMVPTGKIDDSDNHKSKEEKAQPIKKVIPLPENKFGEAVKFLKNGKTMNDLLSFYEINEEMRFRIELALSE